MFFRFLSVLGLCAVLTAVGGEGKTLRVCSDPDNLPMSNQAGEGLENRLAAFVAAKLGDTLEYVWWAQRKSFVEHSLAEGKCDVLMGVPSAMGDIEVTAPYYRSSYVFLTRQDRALHIRSLLDEQLARLRIGINVVSEDYSPPALALASRGVTQNIVGYSLSPARAIVDAVVRGEIDVAIVWGPTAGFFAKTAGVPVTIEPVSPPAFGGIPFTFDISMGLRKGDEVLRRGLDEIIRTDSAAIRQILTEFGVPQIDR